MTQDQKTSQQVEKLRELLEKATPGEWIKGYSDQAEVEFNGSGHYGTIVSGERDCPVAFVPGMDRPYYDDPETDANVELILTMKAQLPALLDHIASLEGENERRGMALHLIAHMNGPASLLKDARNMARQALSDPTPPEEKQP